MAALDKKESLRNLKKSLKIRFWSPGSKQVSLSQGTSPITPGPPSLGDKGGGTAGDGGKTNSDLTITLPHSNTHAMMKKLIVVQKYEPKPGDKGLAVKRGETVLLVRSDGEWLYVKNENGDEGFVPRSHLLAPSRTRTRTNSRSGMALRHVASNGSVPIHSTRLADHSQTPDSPTVLTAPLSQDDYPHTHHSHHHHQHNGHHPPPRLAPTETLYDRKYSPSSSSGIVSLADQFSPGLTHSLPQDREQEEHAQSSSSSLNHSHDSYSSYEQSIDATSNQPTLISPLNHIEGGRESLQRGRGGRRGGGGSPGSNEAPPRSNSNSGRATAESCGSSRVTPVQNGMDGIHYVDKTTNHIYSTLEKPTSPPPPPLPPRNIPGYSASQEPEQSMYSQLEHNTGMFKTCSQEVLIHPSHRHDSYSEGWTREQKSSGLASRNGTTRSRSYKEQVEIRHAAKPRSVQQGPAVPAPARTDRHQQNWREQTKVMKFRKTVWGVFVVTHDFDPLDENEIAIRKGEHVSVWNRDDQDWFWVVKHASSGSEEGFVPSGCLREVSADSKTSASVTAGCHHNSHTPTTPVSGSPRLDDVAAADPIRHRAHSHESRTSNPAHQTRPIRPSSGGPSRSDCCRERRGSEGSAQVHRVHTRDPPSLPTKHSEPLPPSPPSSPPPPYTEFDTNNRRFMSLSQQQPEMHHSQPSGYGHRHGPGMHRTRSQGYVTSRNRAVHYPSSPSSPHGRGEGRVFPDGGTLV